MEPMLLDMENNWHAHFMLSISSYNENSISAMTGMQYSQLKHSLSADILNHDT